MATVRFEKVSVKATLRWKDHGRNRQETKEFWQTISPFNLRADGVPKTRIEIEQEIRRERDQWLAELRP
jgi:hypothetical protein